MSPLSFHWPVRVYIEDTDAAGIVYYANYLRFMERARTECIRALGFPRVETIDEQLLFVVHRVALTYQRPAKLDDSLIVTANLSRLGRTFMVFSQSVKNTDEDIVLVQGEITVACIDKIEFKPRRLPVKLVAAIQAKNL
jgi:tol-pal system-associated acyl-CoA thioesterase